MIRLPRLCLAGVVLLNLAIISVGQVKTLPVPAEAETPPQQGAKPPRAAEAEEKPVQAIEAPRDLEQGLQQAKADPSLFRVEFLDGSRLKVEILAPVLNLETDYGPLVVPLDHITRIDVRTRMPDDLRKTAEKAIARLGSQEYSARETAEALLRELGVAVYPLVLKNADHADPEIAQRCSKLVTDFRQQLPSELWEIRRRDRVTTGHSEISGELGGSKLTIRTTQFGELTMRLSDVHRISRGPLLDSKTIQDPPSSLTQLNAKTGEVFYFRVTGANRGHLWGTNIYTTDSHLPTAAVHAGLLQVGQQGIVKVTILPARPAFSGSTRNGIVSSSYRNYPAAYRVEAVEGLGLE